MAFDKAEVVVIGAGVSGLSTAWWLAKAGIDVVVLEKGVIGYESSSRNGGMVGAGGVSELKDRALRMEAARLWPTMDDELGYPTEYEPGTINVALHEDSLEFQKEMVPELQQMGVDAKVLDADTIKEMAPLISPRILGGLFNPMGGHANPQRSVQAYAWAAQDHGARILQHVTVTGFKVQGESVTAVETSEGDIETNFVVSAAGAQTTALAEMVGAFVPTSPFRPEIAVTAPVEPMWSGAVSGNGLYGRQTKRGNLAYGGGPHEWTDIDDMDSPSKPNTHIIRNIARRIYELWEGAGDVPLIRSWACIVETTPDYSPIIDTLDHPNNYVVVTLASFGFAPSPATGKVAADLVMHGEPSINIDGIRLSRFKDLPRNWRQEYNREKGAYNT